MSKYTNTQTYHSHKCSAIRKNPCQTWISLGENWMTPYGVCFLFLTGASQQAGWPFLECDPTSYVTNYFDRKHRIIPI